MTAYCRILKPGFANDFRYILQVSENVRRVLAGIVGEGVDSVEFVEEVKLQMQPRPDGGLAIIGWIGKDPTSGMPDEQFDEEVELIAEPVSPEQMAPAPAVTTPVNNPFER